jgi:hypothetical protein
MDLGADFAEWSNGTKEGAVETTETDGREGRKELRWRVRVDHETDGGEGGQYPIGWPRVARSFPQGELDFTAYDYLSLLLRVDSNRDEIADDSTRIGLSLSSHGQPRRMFETRVDLGDRQRQWIPLHFSIGEFIDKAGFGSEPWRTVSRVQLFIAENDYAHGTDLAFQVGEVRLLQFTSPVIQRVDVPAYVTLPQTDLPISFDILGTRSVHKGSHTIAASLTSADGRTRTSQQQDLADGLAVVLDTSTIASGRYRLDLTIVDAQGVTCSHETRFMEAVDGPLAGP